MILFLTAKALYCGIATPSFLRMIVRTFADLESSLYDEISLSLLVALAFWAWTDFLALFLPATAVHKGFGAFSTVHSIPDGEKDEGCL